MKLKLLFYLVLVVAAGWWISFFSSGKLANWLYERQQRQNEYTVVKITPEGVWAKHLEDGSQAVGLFNRGQTETTVTAQWSDLGISGKQLVRDLWRQKDLGIFTNEFQTSVLCHGVVLVKISPK